MNRSDRLVWVLGVGLPAGAALAWLLARRVWEAAEIERLERRAEPDPDALAARRRARDPVVGFDVRKLSELSSSSYKPLVEYLSYIQVKRNEGGDSLLFVRDRDLDVMAAMMGANRDQFVDEFQQLQVLLSMN